MKSTTEKGPAVTPGISFEAGSLMDTKLAKALEKHEQQLDLENTARYSGALLRHRGIKLAIDLLRFVFMYSVNDYSLNAVGLWGTVMGLGSLSKTAVLKRLRGCHRWLGVLIVAYLALHKIRFPRRTGLHLRLLDASTVSQPGSTGADWRLHLSFDLGQACMDDVQITDGKQGETLTRWQFQPGDLCLADRAYGVLRSLGVLLGATAWFVIRIGWQNLPMERADGQPFDLIAWLRCISTDPAVASQTKVWVNTPQGRFPLRLIGRPIPPQKAAQVRQRMRQEAKRKKRTLDERSLLAAGFVLVVSNLPEQEWSAFQIQALYRLRWQIELVFKRLKSILQFDHLRAKNPDLAQTYLLAKILAALLIGGIQLQLTERYPEKFGSLQKPISMWRLTRVLFDAFQDAIRGSFSLELVFQHWCQLERYLCEDSRRRIQQLALARQSLGLVCGF